LDLEDDDEDDDYDEISVDGIVEVENSKLIRNKRTNNDNRNEDNEGNMEVEDRRDNLYSCDEGEDENDSGEDQEEDADVEDEDEDEDTEEVKIENTGEVIGNIGASTNQGEKDYL